MKAKKSDLIFLVFLAFVMVFAFLTGAGFKCFFEDRTRYEDVERLEMSFNDISGEFYYEFVLPDDNVAGKNLAYNTSHFSSEVFIDGEKVYECRPYDTSKTNSVGYRWNFIKLYEKDAGKQVLIHEIPPYSGLKPLTLLYFGETSDIYMQVLKSDGLRVSLSFIILMIGVLLLIYSLFVYRLDSMDMIPVYFSVFSILLSAWSASGSVVFDLLFSNTLIGAMINHYSLMLMPVVFIQFLRRIYTDQENRAWKITLYTGIGIVVLRTVLDRTMIAELRSTLWITQLYIVLFAVTGIMLGVKEFTSGKVTHQLRMNIICLIIILAATFLEIIVLKVFNKDSIYGMFCFMIYVVIMAVNIIIQSQKLRERANEAEIYRKLAFTDELTGVFNRTAFRADMDKLVSFDNDSGKKSVAPTVIFMFDLNDLKKCNDQFGHENGDIYISSVSKVIADVFSFDGRCYRIGGDEFSVIMPYTDQNDITGKLNIIEQKVSALNKNKFVVTMSVSAGYAVYDSAVDADLEATMKRADDMMYENKQKFKLARKNIT